MNKNVWENACALILADLIRDRQMESVRDLESVKSAVAGVRSTNYLQVHIGIDLEYSHAKITNVGSGIHELVLQTV